MSPVSCVRFLPCADFEGMKQEEAWLQNLKSVSGGGIWIRLWRPSHPWWWWMVDAIHCSSSQSERPLRMNSFSPWARARVSPFAVVWWKKELQRYQKEKLNPAPERALLDQSLNESAFPSHLQTWDENSTWYRKDQPQMNRATVRAHGCSGPFVFFLVLMASVSVFI